MKHLINTLKYPFLFLNVELWYSGLILLTISTQKMNILLVYPKYPDTFWGFKHALKLIKKKANLPPLGLLTIASMLPEEWNLKLINVNVHELKDKDILWADSVFISAMIVQKESAKEIIDRCKDLGRTVVCGGPYFTSEYPNLPRVDHFVLNEAEITLPLFLADLEKGIAKKLYQSSERPDITKTPIPKWSLINFKDYASLLVQFSRGCPYDCEFCDIIIMNGRTPRTKLPEQMIAELQSIYDMGYRGPVFMVDDNFIGNKIQVKKFLEKLILWQKKHKYPFVFTTEASINLAEDEELMDMMSAANFITVFLGIESPNIESLKECKKYQNVKADLELAVRKIHQKGMQVTGGFIVGFDSDTEHIFDHQYDFIQKMGIVTAMVGLLNAAPGTRLWHRLKSEGRLTKLMSGENTDGSINFMPKMDKDKLINGYKRMITKLYSPKNYYKRINTFLSHYKPKARVRFSFSDFRTFIRTSWRIGILSNERFLYWGLLIRTFFKNRKALPMAIELAVFGVHFFNVVKTVAVV